jgi:uncharacterized protein YecT (DUF1311 family)
MKTGILSMVLTPLLTLHVLGEEPAKKHPIDLQMEKAEEEASSTADQTQTQARGLKLWDAEMNRVYTKLRKRLKPAAADALQVAQRAWLDYRDRQTKFLEEMYNGFEGTMFIPMHAAAVKKVTRARALELITSLQAHEEFAK